MKVKFKTDIKNRILKRGYSCQVTLDIKDDEGKNKYINYYKDFTRTDYFEVKDEDDFYYKIIYPASLNMFVLYKKHVVPYNNIVLDDKLFEWDELK